MSTPAQKLKWDDLDPVDTPAAEANAAAARNRVTVAVKEHKDATRAATQAGIGYKLSWDDLSPVEGPRQPSRVTTLPRQPLAWSQGGDTSPIKHAPYATTTPAAIPAATSADSPSLGQPGASFQSSYHTPTERRFNQAFMQPPKQFAPSPLKPVARVSPRAIAASVATEHQPEPENPNWQVVEPGKPMSETDAANVRQWNTASEREAQDEARREAANQAISAHIGRQIGLPGLKLPRILTEGLADIAGGLESGVGAAVKGISEPGPFQPLANIPGVRDVLRATAGKAGSAMQSQGAEVSGLAGAPEGIRKDIGTGVGEVIPALAAKNPLMVGALAYTQAKGRGASEEEAIEHGLKSAATVGAMGKAANVVGRVIPGAGVGRAVTRIAGRAAANLAIPSAIEAPEKIIAGESPIPTEREVMANIPQAVGFAVLPHPVAEKPRATRAPLALPPAPPEAVTAQAQGPFAVSPAGEAVSTQPVARAPRLEPIPTQPLPLNRYQQRAQGGGRTEAPKSSVTPQAGENALDKPLAQAAPRIASQPAPTSPAPNQTAQRGDFETGLEDVNIPKVAPITPRAETRPVDTSGSTRFYRADRPDAESAQGRGWAQDPEYVSQKYGKGEQGGESVWYIDVPNNALTREYGDPQSVSIIDTPSLNRLGVTVDPKLYRRVPQASAAAPEIRSGTAARERPLYDMSQDEIEAAYEKAKGDDKTLLSDLFGDEGAKRYQRLQRKANSAYAPVEEADKAQAEIERMEGSLSKAQQDRLFGVGLADIDNHEVLKDYRDALGQIGGSTPDELAESIKYSLTELSEKTDPAEMNSSERLAYAQLRHAFEIARENGWDTEAISEQAVKSAATRWADPEDAYEMLKRFMKKPQAEQQPRRPALPPQRTVTTIKPSAPRSRSVSPESDTLLAAIQKLGFDATTAEGSDLAKYLSAKEGGRPGMVNNQRGAGGQKRGVDDLVSNLQSLGYPVEDGNHLLDLVRQEQQGKPTHSNAYDHAAAAETELQEHLYSHSEPVQQKVTSFVDGLRNHSEFAELSDKIAHGEATNEEAKRFAEIGRYELNIDPDALESFLEESANVQHPEGRSAQSGIEGRERSISPPQRGAGVSAAEGQGDVDVRTEANAIPGTDAAASGARERGLVRSERIPSPSDIQSVSTDNLSRVQSIFDALKDESRTTGRRLTDLVEDRINQQPLPGMEAQGLSESDATLLRQMATRAPARASVAEKQTPLLDTAPTVESRQAQTAATEDAQSRGAANAPLFEGVKAEAKEPWQMTREQFTFSVNAPKASIDLSSDASSHQISKMSERQKNDLFKSRSQSRREANARYDAASKEWENKVWDAYTSGEFSINDVFNPNEGDNAFYVVRDGIENSGISVDSPFKISTRTPEGRAKYLAEIESTFRGVSPTPSGEAQEPHHSNFQPRDTDSGQFVEGAPDYSLTPEKIKAPTGTTEGKALFLLHKESSGNFFNDPAVKRALGLDESTSQSVVHKSLQEVIGNSRPSTHEASLLQAGIDGVRRWAKDNNLPPETLAKIDAAENNARFGGRADDHDVIQRYRADLAKKSHELDFNPLADPERAVKSAVVLGYDLYRTAKDFGAWSGRMVRQLGEQIRPYLRSIWDGVKGFHGDERGFMVFHGSPFRFEKFDSSQIGTGEGHQAYGHGLYFSSAKDVAEYYRDNLHDNAYYDSVNRRMHELVKEMDKYRGGEYGKFTDPKGYELKAEYDRLMDEKLNKKNVLYHVNIVPKEENFLDWDKPLSQQSASVRAALEQALQGYKASRGVSDRYMRDTFEGANASTVYKELAAKYGARGSSDYLHSLGIPGIKYRDQMSRGDSTKDGSHNFVVFSDKDVDITATEPPFIQKLMQRVSDAADKYESYVAKNNERVQAKPGEGGFIRFGGTGNATQRDLADLFKTKDKVPVEEAHQTMRDAWDEFTGEGPKTPTGDDLPRAGEAYYEKSKQQDKLLSFRTLDSWMKANMLQGLSPYTHKVGSLASNAVAEAAATPGAAATDWIISKTQGGRRSVVVDPRGMARAASEAVITGVREAWQIMRQGATQKQIEEYGMPNQLNTRSPVVNAMVNYTFRTYKAGAHIFGTNAYQKAMSNQARAWALNEVTAGKITSKDVGRRTQEILDGTDIPEGVTATMEGNAMLAYADAVFQSDNALNDVRKKIIGDGNGAWAFAVNRVVPFMKSASNAYLKMLDYTGVGPKGAGAETVRAVQRKAASGQAFKTIEDQRAFASAWGKLPVGLALFAAGVALHRNGLMTSLTYQHDDNPQPGSVRFLGKLIDVARYSPIGLIMAAGATFDELSHDKGDDPLTASVKVAGKSASNLPMFSQTTDLIKTASALAEGKTSVPGVAVAIGKAAVSRTLPTMTPGYATVRDVVKGVTDDKYAAGPIGKMLHIQNEVRAPRTNDESAIHSANRAANPLPPMTALQKTKFDAKKEIETAIQRGDSNTSDIIKRNVDAGLINDDEVFDIAAAAHTSSEERMVEEFKKTPSVERKLDVFMKLSKATRDKLRDELEDSWADSAMKLTPHERAVLGPRVGHAVRAQ